MRSLCFIIIILIPGQARIIAQQLTREKIVEWSGHSLERAVDELRTTLQIPNNGRDTSHISRNVAWCVSQFKSLNFDTQVVHSEGVPHVIANKANNPTAKTVLFYLQIDGQPIDSSRWEQESPYLPVLKRSSKGTFEVVEWNILKKAYDPDLRIFARSASDSKGPAVALLSALRILQDKGVEPSYNLKVIMDFQEEIGSPTLTALVSGQAELFKADVMVIMDGTRHVSNLPTLTFGARGIATIQLTVFGAKQNLHSGQYGNYAPNPVFKLADILAGMKDGQGKVIIPGFYDGITLTEEFKKKIQIEQEDEAELNRRLGIAKPDKVGNTYQEALQYPSLNVRGLRAAWVHENVRTIIPSEAVAEIDIRLVPETEGKRMVELVRNYITGKGYYIIEGTQPTGQERQKYSKLISFTYKIGSRPFRTSMDSPFGNWLSNCMEHVFSDQYVKMQSTGGSQPIAPFISALNLPAVSVRIPNPDNNIHGPNENLRLGNFLEGIQMCLSILTHPLY